MMTDIETAEAAEISKALQAAAEGGDLQVVDRLLAADADVNAVGDNGWTALQAAAKGGHLQVVERLLAANADVNATAITPEGDNSPTPLQATAARGYQKVVDRLLIAGADVNAAAHIINGRTALQAAAEGGHLAVVDRLLAASADVNAAAASHINGKTALQAAAAGGHLEVVDRLLAVNADVNAAMSYFNGRTALQAAAEGGYLEVVDRLLAANADIDATAASLNGKTAIQAAAEGGHLEVVDRLLTANADINATVTDLRGNNMTILQAAAERGHSQVVDRLLAANAGDNTTTAEGDISRITLKEVAEGSHLKVVDKAPAVKAKVGTTTAAAAHGNSRTDDQLCATCAQLNIAAIFDPDRFDSLPNLDMDSLGDSLSSILPGKSKEVLQTQSQMRLRRSPEWIRHVGSWNPSDLNPSDIRPSCPFCCLLVDVVARGPPFWARHPRELFAFPSHLLYELADTGTGEPGRVPMSTNLLTFNKEFLVLNNFQNEESWKDWLRDMCRIPLTMMSLGSQVVPEQSGPLALTNTRYLQDSSIDYDLFCYWMTICVTQHGNRCAPPNGPPVPRLKLIDCQARRIVNAAPEKKYDYVALSYVWGRDPLQPYDYPLLPEKLPLVILDAMAFVTKLGLQYLWVDRYCIWQDDMTHKMSQVNKMDQIYGDAYFTIFACAGEDPSHGLPGVSTTQRKEFQLSATVGRTTLVLNRGHNEQAERISSSKWKSRGWTFQEEALSRRRLYVTDYEISFICSEMTCFEHLAAPLTFDSNKGDHKRQFWNDVNIPHGIWPIISQYSRRQLTVQSDRIIAISGVLNAWSRLHPKCFSYWGVPIVGAPSCWRILQNNDPVFGGNILTKAFLAGLYVLPERDTQQESARNRDFPSWSWAGQGANIRFLDKYGGSPTLLALSAVDFNAEVWVERPDGTEIGWERFVAEGGCELPQSELTPYLHIKCWVFKVGPFRQLKRKSSTLDTLVFCIAASGNYEEDPPNRVREFHPDFFHSPQSSIFTSEFEAICFEPPQTAKFALVLDTVDGVLERIGVLDFYVFELDDGSQQTLEQESAKIEDAYPKADRRVVRLG